MTNKNTLERLEQWNYRHKAHAVSIDIDDGYGATCWTVTLYTTGSTIIASELWFFSNPANVTVANGLMRYEEDRKDEKPSKIFITPIDNEYDRCGLEKLIEIALDEAENEQWRVFKEQENKLGMIRLSEIEKERHSICAKNEAHEE